MDGSRGKLGVAMALDLAGNPILTLTLNQQERILTYLGYRSQPVLVADWGKYLTKLSTTYPEYVVERITTILLELVELDLSLVSTRSESMAKVVDKLTLDYRQHLRHLHGDGNRLLQELATLTDLSVIYSKYQHGKRSISLIAWG